MVTRDVEAHFVACTKNISSRPKTLRVHLVSYRYCKSFRHLVMLIEKRLRDIQTLNLRACVTLQIVEIQT